MRIAASLVVLAVFALGALTLAAADGDAPDPEKMSTQIDALEAQVEYLRAREDALTAYILLNDQRAEGILRTTKASRDAGFEKNRIPERSRTILLKGMDDLAASLRAELPALTKEQAALRKKADALAKKLK